MILPAQSADLPVIELSKLLDGEAATQHRLLLACREVGFFYLDFQSSLSGNATLEQVEEIFGASERFFDLPVEQKSQYVTKNYSNSKTHGYRGIGLNTGPLEGKKDGFESFMISEQGLFGLDNGSMPFAGPAPIQSAKSILGPCVRDLHEISLTIISSLYRSLGMTDTIPFEECHRHNEPSATGLGLLRYEPLDETKDKVGHIAHTDAGSLTLVFTHVPGLEVLMPDNTWQYALPRPGHAVVNVGDTLTFLSKGQLRSCLHRVVPHPEAVAKTKYSILYLLRPEWSTRLIDSESGEWTAIEWHNRKFNLFHHGSTADMLGSPMLTGRKNYIGYFEQSPAVDIAVTQNIGGS